MPALGAGKQQTKPPEHPELFQLLVHSSSSGSTMKECLWQHSSEPLASREVAPGSSASTPDITVMVWALPTSVVPPPLHQHLWIGEETGKQNELETFACSSAGGSAEVKRCFLQNRNQLWNVRLSLQWGCLQRFPKDQTSSCSSQVSRGSHPAQLLHQAQD